MKKLERRAIICILMTAGLLCGILIFIVKYINDAEDWASFYGNQSIYTNGYLNRGEIIDRNGVMLLENTKEGSLYIDDIALRKSMFHIIGDKDGNVGTSILATKKDELIGYNLITGTYDAKIKPIQLTVDAYSNKLAYELLGSSDGLVCVLNYKTGEILTMVSKPTLDYKGFDKTNLPSGAYLNKVLSSKLVPGSIFKIVTATAAIENLPDLDDFSYNCNGVLYFGSDKVTCPRHHYKQDFKLALANSCNGAFAEITNKLGPNIMKEYVKKLGLTTAYDINGIYNAKGSFEFPDNPVMLGWAGCGQYKDLVNPLSMLVYVGSIANDGVAIAPKLIMDNSTTKKSELISKDTALKVGNLMKNNVVEHYGVNTFRGLDIFAKSGTAEAGKNKTNAWFTGYIKNENKPLAFIVMVEGGYDGLNVAGPIARRVLNYLVDDTH